VIVEEDFSSFFLLSIDRPLSPEERKPFPSVGKSEVIPFLSLPF